MWTADVPKQMPPSVFEILARNEAADTSEWPRRDGNAVSWPDGPRTAARKMIRWPDGVVDEYDTLDNAVAALNEADDGGVHHTKRLWYGLRAGRCPQKLLGLITALSSEKRTNSVTPRPTAVSGASSQPSCASSSSREPELSPSPRLRRSHEAGPGRAHADKPRPPFEGARFDRRGVPRPAGFFVSTAPRRVRDA